MIWPLNCGCVYTALVVETNFYGAGRQVFWFIAQHTILDTKRKSATRITAMVTSVAEETEVSNGIIFEKQQNINNNEKQRKITMNRKMKDKKS